MKPHLNKLKLHDLVKIMEAIIVLKFYGMEKNDRRLKHIIKLIDKQEVI